MSNSATGTQQLLNTNVDGFFARFQAAHGDAMRCREGCSHCCFTSLTVFLSEALVISNWFMEQSAENQRSLMKAWRETPPFSGADASGIERPACTFLRADGRCSIYPARPVVCRTQGVPLLIVSPGSTETKKEITVSHCPLNFSEKNSLPPMAEWLDLGRLTTLQSLATQQAAKEAREVVQNLTVDTNSRVKLSDLRRHLVTLASEHTAEGCRPVSDTGR
jgi:hypothetical protein